jgi:hypothetical protein
MSELAGLEHRYKQLLAWYPAAFRHEQGDELLGVLMAGAHQGQRRPGFVESADLIKSAVLMRIRRMASALAAGAASKRWNNALATFSLAAPLILLLATVLEVAVPYYLPRPSPRYPKHHALFYGEKELGGLSLLQGSGFDITLAFLAIVAVLALFGLRWWTVTAIAGTAAFWIEWGGIPLPFQLRPLAVAVCLLASAALVASSRSRPRRSRELVNWRFGIVVLLASAAVQAATLLYDAASPEAQEAYWDSSPIRQVTHSGNQTSVWVWHVVTPDLTGYVVATATLTVIAVALALAWKQGPHYLLLLGMMLYPFALEVGVSPFRQNSGDDLIASPRPGHVTLLFLPVVLAAVAILAAAALGRPVSSREAAT